MGEQMNLIARVLHAAHHALSESFWTNTPKPLWAILTWKCRHFMPQAWWNPAILAALMLFTAPAFAAPRCYVQRQAIVAHHQAYVAPVAINYFVGQPIRAEAIVEKALRSDPDYEAFKRFKQWKQIENGRPAADRSGMTADNSTHNSDISGGSSNIHPAPSDSNIPDNVIPILYKHCGGCHSGAAPKAGLLLDGTAYIDCKTLVKCIDEISTGSMPKAKPNQAKPELSDADEDAVIAALSRLVQQP